MAEITQQLVNAVALGGLYALVALGLAIVFSIMGLINFAHGELLTLTGYALAGAMALGLPFAGAVPVALLTAVAGAMLLEAVAFRPLRGASATVLLLSSFAVSKLVQILFQNLIDARPVAIQVPAALRAHVQIGGLTIASLSLLSIALSLLALLLIGLFLNRSLAGIAMRAAAQDFAVTRLMGIPAHWLVRLAFALSGLLAGLAGLLWVMQRGSVQPDMGFAPVLSAFIAVVLGGLGSLSGAVLGAMLLGMMEVLLRGFLPPDWAGYREALLLSLVLLTLTLAPGGLIPRRDAVR